MKFPYSLKRFPAIISSKIWRRQIRPTFEYEEVVSPRTWACLDLDAFPRPLPRYEKLSGVVLMEDRDPNFFLSFQNYRPWKQTALNRHGPLHAWTTNKDLKELIGELHQQKIKVLIGFWNYGGQLHGVGSQASFFRLHQEIQRLPWSSVMDPFVTLSDLGISYADYIAHQYEKISETFGFDGLMLGDGFMGFTSHTFPDYYRDKEEFVPKWTEFYATIARKIKRNKGLLFAYDCQGLSYSEAIRHGADYKMIAEAGLDYLIYQSYPTAWAEYWLSGYREFFNLSANEIHLKSVKKALKNTQTHVLYTVELGDSVENWWPIPHDTKKQIERLDPLADGRFLVWGNDLFASRGSTN